jgi:hypothetical protein
MQRHKISSKILAAVGYDAATRDLEVEFRARKEEDKRRVYRYHAVPAEKVTEMMASESKGSYFLVHIKPNYKCTRIEENDGKKDAGSQTPPAAA